MNDIDSSKAWLVRRIFRVLEALEHLMHKTKDSNQAFDSGPLPPSLPTPPPASFSSASQVCNDEPANEAETYLTEHRVQLDTLTRTVARLETAVRQIQTRLDTNR